MAANLQNQHPGPAVAPSNSSVSSKSSASSFLNPNARTARFAEATSVDSPADNSTPSNPFNDPVPTYMAATQPPRPTTTTAAGQLGDFGFGYIQDGAPTVTQTVDAKPLSNGLKSALKTPGAPARNFAGPLSPTFKEDELLEKAELMTDKEQEKDLRIKVRVRLAKIILRGVNFSCSLIVLSLLAGSFTIFNTTKHLAPRNGLPPWSGKTPLWPQITLLVIACISLTFAVFILYSNIRHGHRRAEKVALYYTTFAVGFFIFNIAMWGVGAAILSGALNTSNGNDMWGWACKDNRRRELFQDEVSYGLVCRLQSWSLICAIIEIVIELFIITIYGFVFYRFWSKRRLRKSMAIRDRARSDLYLSQLRAQSAPNTPALQSPRSAFMRHPMSPGGGLTGNPFTKADDARFVVSLDEKPFSLQPVPRKKGGTTDSSPVSNGSSPSVPFVGQGAQPGFFAAAPGEQYYGSVPIPGAYAAPPTNQNNNYST